MATKCLHTLKLDTIKVVTVHSTVLQTLSRIESMYERCDVPVDTGVAS